MHFPALARRDMLATVAIELVPWMDETTPDRRVKPAATAAPSSTAASSFDLVQRANAGDQTRAGHPLRTLSAQAAAVGSRPCPSRSAWRPPDARSRSGHTHPRSRAPALVRTQARRRVSGIRPDCPVESHPRHRSPVSAKRARPSRHRDRGTRALPARPRDRPGDARAIRGSTRATAAGGKRSDHRAHRNGTAPRRNRADVRQAERGRGPHGRQSSTGQAGRGDGA